MNYIFYVSVLKEYTYLHVHVSATHMHMLSFSTCTSQYC